MKYLLFLSLFSALFASPLSNAADNSVHPVSIHARHHHSASQEKTQTEPVDINHADVTALITLKGIGAKKAQRIVAYRQKNGLFKSVNDLVHVKGIGEKGVARLQSHNPGRITINTVTNLR